MTTLRTYKRALATAVIALAVALAGVGLGPASAWASVADGVLGLNVNVPATVQQAPGSSGDAGSKGAPGVLGLNLSVPDALDADPDGGSGSAGDRPAAGVLGLNLNVPSTVQQAPGSSGDAGSKGSAGVFGLNLRVPDTVSEGDPGDVGGTVGTSPAAGVLGLNINVPSTVTQAPGASGETAGAAGVLGLNMNVPRGAYVTFDANGGQGSWLQPIVPGEPVRSPELVGDGRYEGGFYWPARVIEGWYTDAACSAGSAWDFSQVPEGAMTLYAKWVLAEEPHPTADVTLHVLYENTELIDAASYGISGYEGPADGGDGHGPVYEGSYLLGGALPPDLDGTLALPAAEMEPTDELDGLFDGWYRSCTFGEDGEPVYRDRVAQNAAGDYTISRYDEGNQELWAKWKLVRTHHVTFDAGAGAWDDGTTTQVVRVEHGRVVAAPNPAPTLAGHDLVGWEREDGSSYRFGTPVYESMTLTARYAPIPEFVVTFDAGEGHFADGQQKQTQSVQRGQTATRPDDPVRAGYAFAGWHYRSGTAYDFGSPVTAALTLYAKWTADPDPPEPPDPPLERLDVTVPVSVGFAVDAVTGEATGPEMGRYAIKSRTPRPVSVERLDLVTSEADLEGLFELPAGRGWQEALERTFLRVRSERAGEAISLVFAGEAGPGAGTWASGHAIADGELPDYTLDAFGGAALEGEWWLTDACVRLGLELGLDLPVRDGLLAVDPLAEGMHEVTRLKVTVSTRE